MKTLFQNTFTPLLVLTIAGLFTFTSCKCKRGCEGFDSATEQLISPAIKTSILGFPDTAQWVFKCVSDTNKIDTIFLAA